MGVYDIFGDLLKNLVYLVLYPLIAIFSMLIEWVRQGLNLFIDLYDSISGLGVTLINFITSSLSFLPALWLSLILLGISIIIVLRIYSFLKDISIAGFKI